MPRGNLDRGAMLTSTQDCRGGLVRKLSEEEIRQKRMNKVEEVIM